MTPVNSNSSFPALISGQITWNGPAIPCLKICSGDKLNNVVYLIATKVCELTSPMDLTNLNLQCALDIFDRDEVDSRTVSSIFQLLIDNQCGIKELIDTIQQQINGSEEALVLNLGCLISNYTDEWGQPLPYTTKSILQDLINKVCTFEDELSDLYSKYSTLKTEVDNHISNHPTPNEVVVTTCITSASPVSVALIELAADYCTWKANVGTTAQAQTAISRQTSEINAKMQTVTGWILNPQTALQSLNNVWLYQKYNDDRITLIEENCCKVTCKDILVGFNIIPNEEGDGISLAFTTVAGTDIPSGITDLGSVVTIKDKNGLSISYNIAIAQEATLGEYSISGLDTSENLTVSIQAFIGNSSLQCQKCLSKQFAISSNKCCTITNTSDSNVTIIYTT